MTLCCFQQDGQGRLTGFEISGHSGYAQEGQDIVCAGISSAVMLVTDLLEETFHQQGVYQAKGDRVICKLRQPDEIGCKLVEGLHCHLANLQQDYPEFIQVKITK